MFGNIYDVHADDPRVKLAVIHLQNQGAPQEVEYADEMTPYGFEAHVVRFKQAGKVVYEAVAGLLMMHPAVSLTEMKALGIIR